MNGFAPFHRRQQRAVRALATVLVFTTLATLLLLDALQPGAEPEASGREVPSFVLAALPGEDDHTVLVLQAEPMPT
jgi:hypothetical protein